ncbi:MAG: hypothetical protein IKZ85_02145 [Pseudobutyrivibrio sp.]|nr:hypothetical protein [Pseudobutyrivibrio sp.]
MKNNIRGVICYWLSLIVQILAGFVTTVICAGLSNNAGSDEKIPIPNMWFGLIVILLVAGFIITLFRDFEMKEEIRFLRVLKMGWKGIDYYIVSAVIGISAAYYLDGKSFNFYSNVVVYLAYIFFYFLIIFVTNVIANVDDTIANLSLFKKMHVKGRIIDILLAILFVALFYYILYRLAT